MTDVPEVDDFQQEILDSHNGFTYGYVGGNGWDIKVRTYQEDFFMRKNIPYIRMVCVKKKGGNSK
jgi:hypothetical protein